MKNFKLSFVDLFSVVLGNLVLAIGVGVFIIPTDILTGGLAGVAIAVQPIFHIDPQLVIYALTFILFILGWLFLGKGFAAKTMLSTFLYPAFLFLVSLIVGDRIPVENELINSIYGGILTGLGVGLVFRANASTGGMDVPPLIIHKFTGIPLASLVLITDAITVLLGMSTYGLYPALVGLISVWTSSVMIEKTLVFGSLAAKQILVVSEKWEQIRDVIHEQLERGTTLLKASGGYSNHQNPVLMVVISQKQYPRLQKVIMEIDPSAFVIASNVQEVLGLGFTYEEEY